MAAAGAAGLILACGGEEERPPSGAQAPAGDNAAAATGRGLLLPRDQRLLLRDMADGKETVMKRSPSDAYFTYPRWSPDGKQIAYALDIPFLGQPNAQWGGDVVVAAADGSGERVVLQRPPSGRKVEGVAWSADGAGLYAGILETDIRDGRLISQTLTLDRIEVADGARRTIAPDATYPAAAADGSRIAFVTYQDSTNAGGLWLANPDGGDRRLLVEASGRFIAVAYPRFSPDGKTIAFSAITPMDVWLVATDGGAPRRLTSFLEDEPYPAWSPDGQQLAIVATGGLYTVAVAGGDPKKVGLGGTQVQIDWR
jgi:Tol biopolymer transport system component